MKNLFFVCATVLAVTASANTKNEMVKNVSSTSLQMSPEVVVGNETLHLLTADEVRLQLKVAPKANVKAWYNRPTGTMWQTYITTDGKPYFQACMAPYLHVSPWKDVTFKSASTNAAKEEWKVYYRKKATIYDTPEVTSQWGCRVDTIPVLTAYDANGSSNVYTPQGFNSKGLAKYASYVNAYTGYINQYRPGASQHFWSSPKFFAAESNRDGTKSAAAYTASVTNSSGQPAGNLMGKNSIGLDGIAIAAEAPAHPYIINRVGLYYQSLSLAAGATMPLTATIYKLESVPAYTADGMPVIMDEPTEVLAKVTVNVNAEWLASQPEQYKAGDGYYHGILPFVLSEPLVVNSAILVCVDGYNVAAVNSNFSSVYSSDYFDEGHGEIGYVKMVADGKPTFIGLRGSFVASTRYTAPAVLLDEERRFLELNKADEVPYWNTDSTKSENSVELFSYYPAAQINVDVKELNSKGEVINTIAAPDWLNISLEDQRDPAGNLLGSGIVYLNLEASDNHGQKRSAQIELSFPGVKLVYTVNQDGVSEDVKGDVNGDGTVDVSDVTALINKILGTADYPDAKCDINEDGVINVSDVTALISIILAQ